MKTGTRSDPTFAIVANGFADGPAQALRDYLVAQGETLVTVFHPLTQEGGNRHVIASYRDGSRAAERVVRFPLKPPASFLADPLIPLVPPRVDAWFGFNPLACARGLVARKGGRARAAVLWSVDFVPDRFGPGTTATAIYDRLDRWCCTRADGRVELSAAARVARDERHGLRGDAARAHVVPMGAWIERVQTTPANGLTRRRVVFLGHLVRRQGVDVLLEALALLRSRGEEIGADIIGTGPLEAALREQAAALGLEQVQFHGFVADHRDVERILAAASVAVAPYRPEEGTFTPYADPGKLKAYVAAGLPIVLTDVPPNAEELAEEAGAEVVTHDVAAFAAGISRAFSSPSQWEVRREAALRYARRFDWGVLLPNALERLGLRPR